MTAPLRVLAIGSCRIFRPLRRAHEAGALELVNHSDRWWFTHTAGEARQYVDTLTGKTSLPTEVRPFICETSLDLPENLSAPNLTNVDAVCVEVSTFKSVTLDGFRLNYHQVWGHAERAGVDSRAALQGQPVHWPEEDQPLRRMIVNRSSPEAVQEDLLAVKRSVGSPVLVVDHLHAHMATGGLAHERLQITETLAAGPLPFYSTRVLIEQHGQEVSLKDHNHWASDFEATVGEDLTRHLRAVADATTASKRAPGPRRWVFSRNARGV